MAGAVIATAGFAFTITVTLVEDPGAALAGRVCGVEDGDVAVLRVQPAHHVVVGKLGDVVALAQGLDVARVEELGALFSAEVAAPILAEHASAPVSAQASEITRATVEKWGLEQREQCRPASNGRSSEAR